MGAPKKARGPSDPCKPFYDSIADMEEIVLSEKESGCISELEGLLDELEGLKSWKEVQPIMVKFRKKHKFTPKKNALLHIHRRRGKVDPQMDRLLRTKKVRSLSGVLVVTVLTSPHPEYEDETTGRRKVQSFSCKHNCYYCPNEPAHEGNNFVPQPRSYLHDEPGVLRANQCGFDAATQFRERITSYVVNGHPVDKIEVLVLGGTWSEYPHAYQKEFVRDIFYAANTVTSGNWREERLSLDEEILLNVDAHAKIIGITLETRPDSITVEEIMRLRSYGCTRIQLGIQHTDDVILEGINRGHGVQATMDALRLLKDNCFKVDIHIMPNLPGSNVEKDEAMFKRVLEDPCLQADQWKIYPCSVVPWTVIEKWHAKGIYKPYPDTELFELLLRVKPRVHPWIRLNRVVRDIPNQYITGGCAVTNMRQALQNELKKRGMFCHCMRCREIRDESAETPPRMMVRKYRASGGLEYFLSFESSNASLGDRLHGFIRLRIPPRNVKWCLEELHDCALVRELHVYGQLQITGHDVHEEGFDKDAPQHKGLGTRLLDEVEKITASHGFYKVAIISGVGVRRYYERRGYKQIKLYQVKELTQERQRAERYRRRLFISAGVIVASLAMSMLISLRHLKKR